MNRESFLTALLALTVACTCSGQLARPAKPLGCFDRAVGSWEGRGQLKLTDAGAPVTWTARMTVRRILQDHFVQQDLRVMFSGWSRPLVARRIFGHDRETNRFLAFSVDNTGLTEQGPVYWTEDGALVGSTTRVERGRLSVQTWSFRFSEDLCELRIQRWGDQGIYFDHVLGTLDRSRAPFSADDPDDAINPVTAEMKSLDVLAGRWRFEGQFCAGPAERMCGVSGTSITTPLMGGHVLRTVHTLETNSGLPNLYRTELYLAWDATSNCYKRLVLLSDGRSFIERAHLLTNGSLVLTSALVEGGMPQTVRRVLQILDDGDLIRVTADRSVADAEGDTSQDVTFVRVRESEGSR